MTFRFSNISNISCHFSLAEKERFSNLYFMAGCAHIRERRTDDWSEILSSLSATILKDMQGRRSLSGSERVYICVYTHSFQIKFLSRVSVCGIDELPLTFKAAAFSKTDPPLPGHLSLLRLLQKPKIF